MHTQVSIESQPNGYTERDHLIAHSMNYAFDDAQELRYDKDQTHNYMEIRSSIAEMAIDQLGANTEYEVSSEGLQNIYFPNSAEERRKLTRLAEIDPLTELGNRRAFDAAIESAEADPNTSVIMIDIDNFHDFNKKYGHQAGDEVIRDIGKILKESADRQFRYGGDEFAILVDNNNLASVIENLSGKSKNKTINNLLDNLLTNFTFGLGDNVTLADTHLKINKAMKKVGR